MKKLLSITFLMCLITFVAVGQAVGQNYSKRVQKERKRKRNLTNAKSAYKKPTKTLYLGGMKNAMVYGNFYDDRILFGLGGEYFLTQTVFIGGYAEYLRQDYFDSYRTTSTLGADIKSFLYSVNNTFYITAKAGLNYSNQALHNINPSREVKPSIFHGTVGAEIMIHLLYNFSVYTDIRNYLALNDKKNNKVLWSLGVKMTLR